MKLIFHCFSGSYHSALAAAVYLGILPADRVPTDREFEQVPFFDQIQPREYGTLNFMGTDIRGNAVYTLGRKNLAQVTIRALQGIAGIYGAAAGDLRFIDASGKPSNLQAIGGFFSVRLGLPGLGRPLVIRAAKANYDWFRQVAGQVQAGLSGTEDEAPVAGKPGLRIFYSCYGSAHSSILASAIHLGLLPSDHRPFIGRILSLPHFDKTAPDQIGYPLLIGTDERGVTVYAIGLKSGRYFLRRAIFSLLRCSGIPEQDLILVNALAYVNLVTRLGGYLSRGLGQISLGRPLVALGIWQTYHDFVDMVAEVKLIRDRRLRP